MANSEEIRNQTRAIEELNSEQEQNLRVTRDINNEIREGLKLINQEKDLKTEVRKAINEVAKAQSFQVNISKDVNKALTDTTGLLKKQQDLSKATISLEKNRKDLSKKIFQEINDLAATRNSLSDKEIDAIEKQIEASKGVARALRNQIQQQKHSKKILDSQVEVSQQLADLGSVKLFDSLSAIADAIPGVKNLTKGFDKAAEASKKAAADMVTIDEKTGKASKLNIFQKSLAGLKGLSAGFGELMKSFGTIAIIGKLVQGLLKADKSTGAIAKGLNQTYEQAELTGKQIKNISNTSNDIAVTYDGVKHSLLDINNSLGTSANLSDTTLENFTSLQVRAGLTSDELMGMQKISFANGKTLKQNADLFLDQANSVKEQYGVSLNSKKLMAEIGKISAATTLSLGKNPKEIAKAVATTKALGMEMSKVEGIADSLLNFESSIEKELEAELLLGKNINLEKARQAALNNDLATVAEEIAKQAGSSADFAKMNRIQQQALADAVGMSREELAQTLFTQEQLAGLSKEDTEQKQKVLDKLTAQYGIEQAQQMVKDQGLKTLEAQLSEQEKMKLAADKMNEVFLNLGTSLQPALEMITKMMTSAQEHMDVIIGMIGFYKTLNMLQKAGAAIQNVIKAREKAGLGLKIAGLSIDAAKSAAAIPVIGFGLAAAAGLAAFMLGKSLMAKGESETKDDVMLPGQGNSGYGNRIISAPEGTFALNNKDTIIAGTNLDQGGGGNASSTKLEQLQSQTNTLLSQLLNKNASIKMDSEELGTAISLNNYEVSA